MDRLSLLTDQALGETDEQRPDGLGFDTYAQILADAAVGTKGPFTIGVFGEWGSGKTSLLRMVQKNLSREDDVVVVWFNAWRYEREDHPIIPLIATIIRELEQHERFLKKLGARGRTLLKAMRAVAYGFSMKATAKIPWFAGIEASFLARDAFDRASKSLPNSVLERSIYYNAYETLSGVGLGQDMKIVVIIDDLDRCFPDKAIWLLESIKLVLSQPGFIFILGVARRYRRLFAAPV